MNLLTARSSVAAQEEHVSGGGPREQLKNLDEKAVPPRSGQSVNRFEALAEDCDGEGEHRDG